MTDERKTTLTGRLHGFVARMKAAVGRFMSRIGLLRKEERPPVDYAAEMISILSDLEGGFARSGMHVKYGYRFDVLWVLTGE
jgi:hypothetical protein